MAFNEIAVLGPGLLGGSIGLATRERGLGKVRYWGRSEEKLEAVRKEGFFASTDLKEVVEGVGLVILATPVGFYANLAKELLEVGGDFVVTDVGSVKGVVEKSCAGLLRQAGIPFVGSHPMAGSEQGGFTAARADLFEGAACFICTEELEDEAEGVRSFWEGLGCKVTSTTAGRHDEIVARISHLPHALASVGAKVALRHEEEGRFGGGGLVDTTRVAGGNPEMWTGIFLENRQAVVTELARASEELSLLQNLLAQGDEVELLKWLTKAKEMRDQLS